MFFLYFLYCLEFAGRKFAEPGAAQRSLSQSQVRWIARIGVRLGYVGLAVE